MAVGNTIAESVWDQHSVRTRRGAYDYVLSQKIALKGGCLGLIGKGNVGYEPTTAGTLTALRASNFDYTMGYLGCDWDPTDLLPGITDDQRHNDSDFRSMAWYLGRIELPTTHPNRVGRRSVSIRLLHGT